MKISDSRNRRIKITFYTMAIVAVVLSAYFFLYVQNREAYLHERNLRVLHRIQQNIEAKNETLMLNVENSANDLRSLRRGVVDLAMGACLKQLVFQLDSLEKEKEELLARRDSLLQVKDPEPSPEVLSRLEENINKVSAEIAPLQKEREVLENERSGVEGGGRMNIDPEQKIFRLTWSLKDLKQKEKEALRKQLPSQITFEEFSKAYQRDVKIEYSLSACEGQSCPDSLKKTAILTRGKNNEGWKISYIDFIQVAGSTSGDVGTTADRYKVTLSRDISRFMQALLRPRIFDETLLIKLDQGGAQVVFQTASFPIQTASLKDSLNQAFEQEGLSAQIWTTLSVGNRGYYAYFEKFELNNEEVILGGLVNTTRFNGERYQVSAWVILMLSLFLLTLVLALPVLKLRLMSRYEQLRSTDVLLSMAAAIFGTALLVLLVLDLYVYNLPGLRERKKHLIELSESISGYFLEEVTTCYEQLEAYDANPPQGDQVDILARAGSRELRDFGPHYPRIYPFFTSVFWVDAQKDTIAQELTVKKTSTAKVSVAGRSYLEKIKSGQPWTLPDGRQFMLESLLTRTSGEHQAVISKKSRQAGKSIIFMLTNLYSVIRPVIPPGFGYAVIDESGLVWFHSNPTHNLQENFLEECDVSPLKAAMFARSPLYEDGSYQGEQYHFYLSPIEGLPLFLVTFREKNYVRSVHEQIISFTFLLMSITFLLGISLVVLLLFFAPKSSRLRGERFLFSWLQPLAKDNRKYKALAFINFGCLVILTLFTFSENTLSVATMFGFSYVFSFLIAYMALETKQARRLRKSPELQRALRYVDSHSLRKRYLEFYTFLASRWGLFILLIVLAIVLLDLAIWSVQEKSFDRILQFQLCSIAWGLIGAGFYYRRNLMGRLRHMLGWQSPPQPGGEEVAPPQQGKSRKLRERPSWKSIKAFSSFSMGIINDYRISFRAFLLSWLLILSFVPVVKYYSVAYDRETELGIKLSQLQLARSVEAHEAMVGSLYRDRGVTPGPNFVKDLAFRGIYSTPYFSTTLHFDTLFSARLRVAADLDSVVANNLKTQLHNSYLSAVPDSNSFLFFWREGQTPHQKDARWSSGHLCFLPLEDSCSDFCVELRLPGQYPEVPPRWIPPARLSERRAWWSQYLTMKMDSTLSGRILQTRISLQPRPLPPLQAEEASNGYVDSLIARTRPRFSDIVTQTGLLRARSEADSLWHWGKALPDTTQDIASSRLHFDYAGRLSMESLLPSFKGVALYKDKWLKVLMLVALLLWMYALLDFNLKRMFSEDVLDMPLPTEEEADELILSLAGDARKKNLFVVVPPRAMGSRYFLSLHRLEGELQSQGKDLCRFTFKHSSNREIPLPGQIEAGKSLRSWLEDKQKEGEGVALQDREVVIFNHFEEGIDDSQTLKNRLYIVNEALSVWDKVVLISTVDLSEFKEQYNTWIREEQDKASASSLRKVASEWSQTLSYFIRVLYPMTVLYAEGEKPLREEEKSETDLLIDEECCHGSYLLELRDDLKKNYEGKEVRDEDVILDIQSRARPYYQELWERTTPEERYVLYDLAEDGLVNTQNLDALRRLLLKGLVINTGDQIKIMNRSFRHHILTAISPEDAFQIETKIQAESLWRLIQTPLTIILVAIGAFLFITQREFISDTVKIIGAAVAFLPGLIQLFNTVSGLNLLKNVNLPFMKKGT